MAKVALPEDNIISGSAHEPENSGSEQELEDISVSGSVREPDDSESEEEEEIASMSTYEHRTSTVSAALLIKYLRFTTLRTVAYRAFPFFVLFLLLFVVNMGSMYMSWTDQGSYMMTTALRKNLMEDETFKEITTHEDFYDWIKKIANNFWVTKTEYDQAVAEKGPATTLYKTRTLLVGIDRVRTGNGLFAERQNYPLHFMLLRQKRVQTEDCASREQQAKPLDPELWQRIEKTCIDKLSESDRKEGPLRNSSNAFPTVSRAPGSVPYTHITTDPFVTDSDEDCLYSAKLPYQELFLGDVQRIVLDLKANDWIDFTTREVAVETIVYNAVRHEYVVLCYVVEFTHSGLVMTSTTSVPFWLMFLNGPHWHRYSFACDILSAVYWFVSAYELGWKYLLCKIMGQWTPALYLEFGKLLHGAHLASLLVYLVYRSMMWWQSDTMSSDMPGTVLYDNLLSYRDVFVWAKHWGVATFLCTLLRFYEYIQYTPRLHSRVTETISLAASDLVIVLLLALLVSVAFGLVANIIYGCHVKELNTIDSAISWLVRSVISGDVDKYQEMLHLEPVWTPIFLVIYFIIVWLLLLNVVLGILTEAFTEASGLAEEHAWGSRQLVRDAWYWWHRAWKGEGELETLHSVRMRTGAGAVPPIDAEFVEVNMLTVPFCRKHALCVRILREYVAKKRCAHNNTKTTVFDKGDVRLSLGDLLECTIETAILTNTFTPVDDNKDLRWERMVRPDETSALMRAASSLKRESELQEARRKSEKTHRKNMKKKIEGLCESVKARRKSEKRHQNAVLKKIGGLCESVKNLERRFTLPQIPLPLPPSPLFTPEEDESRPSATASTFRSVPTIHTASPPPTASASRHPLSQ